MSDDLPTLVRPQPERSELQKFASWFFQDWELAYSDFHTGAQMHIDALSTKRRATLAIELRDFLHEHTGKTSQELREVWISVGAEAWPRDLHLEEFLEHFIDVLEGNVD